MKSRLFRHRPGWQLWLTGLITVIVALVVRHLTQGSDAGTLIALNTFEVVDWMMQESLDLLVNKLAIGASFNTQVQKEFEKDFAPGETVRVKFPNEYIIRDGLAYSEQAIQQRHTTVTCNQVFGIDFGYDSIEKAFRMERNEAVISKQYLDYPMAQLAQEIESRCALWAKNNAGAMVGILGTDPTSFDTSSAASRQKLTELGCPSGGDRSYFTPPSVMRALKNTNSTAFNPQVDVSKMMRTGVVGYGDGFDWYESVSLYSHTAGTWAGAVTVTSAVASGSSSFTITATAADTVKAGDRVSIANVNATNPRTRRKVGSSARTWCVAQDLTAAGGGADTLYLTETLYGPGSPYQNVDAMPAAGAALTLWPGTSSPNGKSGTISLALHPNAFALVAVPFDNPKGSSVEIAKQLTDDETGISIAFIKAFDPIGRRWIHRFDTCLGFGNLYNGNCAVAIAGA